LATLTTESGDPVLRRGGLPLNSAGPSFEIFLEETPPYEDGLYLDRSFVYRFVLPLKRAVPGPLDIAPGRYRLSVSLPGESGPTEVQSGVFEVQ